MVDRERILSKLDELDAHLAELRSIAPARFDEYLAVEKRRACERLLQISVEAVIDTCALLVTVQEYGRINDRLVFETVRERLGDFGAFKGRVLAFLRASGH